MKLLGTNRTQLLGYLEAQLNHLFPDQQPVRPSLDRHLDDAVHRLAKCIDGIKPWKRGEFDYLHSTQYAFLLYYLSNTIWRQEGNGSGVCTKLFLLNKALNGIDCFYEIEMPEVFFIGHTVGIVLAKAVYGNHLVLYQNSTVGKNHGVAPTLEDGVILYPNTAIIGRSRVGAGTIISQGTSVINQDTPGNCLVFPGGDGTLVFKAPGHAILDDFFR